MEGEGILCAEDASVTYGGADWAKENGLKFLHSDIHIADDERQNPWENATDTLIIHPMNMWKQYNI